MDNKELSRRDFLKVSGTSILWFALKTFGLIGVMEGLSGCSNQQVPESSVQISDLLKEKLGHEWTGVVREQLAGTLSVGLIEEESGRDEESRGIARFWLAEGIATGARWLDGTLGEMKMELLYMGDLGLESVAREVGDHGLAGIRFYYENVRGGGFVVYVPDEDSWYKFFPKLSGEGLMGYHQQAVKIWEENLRLWGVAGEVKLGTTIIGDQEYVFHKTPNVGVNSLEKLFLMLH